MNSVLKMNNLIVFMTKITILLLAFFTIPLVNAADNWQDDWTFTKNTTAKTITLTKYKGSEETYKLPAKAIIDGEEYSVILGNGSNSSNKPLQGSIKNFSVEEGVKINNINYLFYQTTNLESVDLTGADTSGATNAQGMFYGATGLKKVTLSGLDMSKVTNVRYMFYQASNIEEIDFSNTDMSSVTSFAYSNASNNFSPSPFYAMYKLKKINVSNFDTSSLTTAQRMFTIDANNSGNRNIVEEIDVTNWKTPKITTLNEAFKHCGENNEIVIKGLETLDVSKVTDFGGTFQSTYNLKDLSGVEKWNTSSAERMNSMFSEAKSITKLDLSGWDTSNVTTISSMFVACEKLSDINVSTWNTSKVKSMDEVFKGCSSLEILNLKGWTSESVENKAGSHMNEMLGIGNSLNAGDYTRTPLKEITLNDNFKFSTFVSPGLRGGYWHLKEGTTEQVSKRFTPARLYTAYNDGITPPAGYSYSHTYVLTELDPANAEYYAHGWGDNNVWEVHYPADKFKGYCINLHRGSPSGYYDRTKVSNNSIIDEGFLDSENYGYEPLGSTMEEALITLIYYGYGNDAAGIQEKYGLTDGEYLLITQQAIWDYTDRYNNISERDKNTKYGKAHYELVSKRFSDIPNNDKLKLYLYESIDGKQNLLSISGLSDVAHAGVRVLKLANSPDGSFEPLIGAEFTIYNSDNEAVGTIKSDENGYATKYNTDSIYGLPEGIYTIRETKAPRGYNQKWNNYKFIVRPADDNEIITIGKLNGSGEDVPMIFENTANESVQGGGLIIKIVDGKNNPILTGATFEILDENGRVVDTVTTGANGSYRTGKKDLDLNKKYTARLKNPPKGYITTVEVLDETLTENEKYKTLVFKFVQKTCKVNIKATKKYNIPLNKDDFKFKLYNVNDKTSVTSTNDKNGNINFNLNLDASNLGYMIYNLTEEKGNLKNVTYDNHMEEVVVSVEDEGGENLTCKADYNDNSLVFNNTYTKEKDTPDKDKKDNKPNKKSQEETINKKDDIPETGDNIMRSVWMFIFSSLGTLVGIDYLYKKNKRKIYLNRR